MKAGDHYGRDEISACIPHRGRNLLVDRIDFFEEGGPLKGRSVLKIEEGDGDGRTLFLQAGETGMVYSEFVLVEHVALTSAVLISPDTGEGNIAFFSTITNFRGGVQFPAGEEIVAIVSPSGRRGPFHRSRCSIVGERGEGEDCVELMAAVVERGEVERMEGEKKSAAPPEIREKRPIDMGAFPFKDPAFVFIEEECTLDGESLTLTARYAYPFDHPFVPGHFPGNPVMMGVTQWAGMLDSAFWLIHRLDLPPGRWQADGQVLRADGTLVTEIKGMQFLTEERGKAPRLLATRRIGFRDMVRTKEEIFYRVRIQSLST